MKKNVLEFLEETARKTPEKNAFGDVKGDLSYRSLVKGAKSCGSFLSSKIKRCEPVAFFLEKSNIAIQGMLGAVYAGGFYSIIDVRLPATRAKAVLEILSPTVLLTDSENEEKAKELGFGGEIYLVEDMLEGEIDEESLERNRSNAQDIDPLYVNFTSGSTGTPKGVTVSHRSVLEFIECFVETFGICERDVIGNQAPFDFDVSVKDIYSGLKTGAKVQIIPREYFSVPTKLMDYLTEKKVTTLIWAVSAMCFVSVMGGFEYKVPREIRQIMFSGEVLPIKHLNKWKKYLPSAKYVNLYGPTEITCNCTYHILDREYEEGESIPIGKPFSNEKVFLLKEDGTLVTEESEEGEICVSGTALALGYYKDFERTSKSFCQNPTNDKYIEKIYRTGDIGKFDEDQNLHFVCRKDFQIKHQGHRIELGEIEAQTMRCESVGRACCVYDTTKKRLHLFYTGEKSVEEVGGEIKKYLPQFMLPNSITNLSEMPITKNGKIDRGALLEKAKGAKK